MNTLKPVLAALFLCVFPALADDVRVVGTATVNLQPIHEWKKSKSGERPMAHWKFITFQTISVGMTAYPKCQIATDGETKVVFVSNVPKTTITAFSEVTALSEEESRLEKYIEAETVRVRNMEANAPSSAYEGSPGYEQIRQVNVAKANLETSRENQSKLRKRISAAEARVKNIAVELAMFTGRKYAGLEVWDCGIKKQ